MTKQPKGNNNDSGYFIPTLIHGMCAVALDLYFVAMQLFKIAAYNSAAAQNRFGACHKLIIARIVDSKMS